MSRNTRSRSHGQGHTVKVTHSHGTDWSMYINGIQDSRRGWSCSWLWLPTFAQIILNTGDEYRACYLFIKRSCAVLLDKIETTITARVILKVILYSYLTLKKMNERIRDS